MSLNIQSDLTKLAKPFPRTMVQEKDTGNFKADFVAHTEVTQKLLFTVGPFDVAVVEILRGPYPVPKDPRTRGRDVERVIREVIQGCVLRCTYQIDGQRIVVEEAGDCEDPANWPTEGARLKDAVSDGIKRCAMRVGVGLHLWADNLYVLHDVLTKGEEE